MNFIWKPLAANSAQYLEDHPEFSVYYSAEKPGWIAEYEERDSYLQFAFENEKAAKKAIEMHLTLKVLNG